MIVLQGDSSRDAATRRRANPWASTSGRWTARPCGRYHPETSSLHRLYAWDAGVEHDRSRKPGRKPALDAREIKAAVAHQRALSETAADSDAPFLNLRDPASALG